MTARLWISIALVAALAAPAAADATASCNFLEISATTGAKPTIDPALQPLAKKLRRPPFAGWNVFHLLSKFDKPLERLKAAALPLKQGAASVLLRDRDAHHLELTVTMDGADGKRVLDVKQSVPVGEWVLLVGTNAKDDGHILALTCR
jgi:hypothetical protein